MSKPKFETWFMEGRLEAGVHYVEVKDDYSDLIEKMDYYTTHPNEAEAIIANAHDWIEQFQNPRRERLISLLVANKYFQYSDQKYDIE
jgi:spore maturation protein CgeB